MSEDAIFSKGLIRKIDTNNIKLENVANCTISAELLISILSNDKDYKEMPLETAITKATKKYNIGLFDLVSLNDTITPDYVIKNLLIEKEISKRLIEEMKFSGLTQKQIEEKTGIKQGVISKYMNGRLPDLLNFAKICKALDIDPAEIVLFELK